MICRILYEHTVKLVQGSSASSIYSRELVEQFFVQPYCRIANLVDSGIAKRQTASAYLKQLCDIGVLQEHNLGREKLFLHPKFLILLTQDNNKFAPYPPQKSHAESSGPPQSMATKDETLIHSRTKLT